MRYGYKEIGPEETIKNIKDFFEKEKGCILTQLNSEETESGSWWNNFNLTFNGNIVGRANGKGASQTYALASGMAEMYERFCSLINSVFTIYPINKTYKEINFNKHKYYVDPEEKIISYEEAIKASPRIYHLFKEIDDGKGNAEKYWSMLFNDKIISVPYRNFINPNESKYLVPEFVIATTGSDGMAAGNTFEEACVQGSSEVCEHYVWHRLNTQKDRYKVIDLNAVSLSPYLTNMLNKIEAKGYKVLCYDFSYTYQVPVLGLVIADLENQVCFLNLGSHPVFEVALERIITETYQGNASLKNRDKKMMMPYSLYGDVKAQLSDMGSVTQRKIYNEELFYNIDQVSQINQTVFLTHSIMLSNKDFYEYYCNLFHKLKWNVYVKDWSLSNNISMVHVFVDNVLTLGAVTTEFLKKLTLNEKTDTYKILISTFEQVNDILNNETTNNYFKDFNDVIGKNEKTSKFISLFPSIDLFHLYYKNKFNKYSFERFFQKIDQIDFFLSLPNATDEFSKFFYDFFKQYKILITYGFYAKESREKIEKIAEFYNINYTKEDYDNMYNKTYYYFKIQQIIQKEYHSQSFFDYVSLFIKE